MLGHKTLCFLNPFSRLLCCLFPNGNILPNSCLDVRCWNINYSLAAATRCDAVISMTKNMSQSLKTQIDVWKIADSFNDECCWL